MSTPLESHLRGLPSRPEFRLTGPEYRRGYMAQWEVRVDDTLWLTGLKTRPDDDGPDPGLRQVFPAAAEAVAATWVSQLLRSTDGQRRYDPIGYGSRFTHETKFAVYQGRLVMVEEIDGRTDRLIGTEFTTHLEGLFGPEEGAFLRAIRSAPEDSAPKLVYADWLDERYDARGAIVRLAEKLRALLPDAAARERAAHRDLIRTQSHAKFWAHIVDRDGGWLEVTPL
ncbi:MAG TPA: TIGR02996 domain-containing protein [Gemmataceae bacterium]|nr:TIGR02996 domain-containing protein [Gemmataceae bacterium]